MAKGSETRHYLYDRVVSLWHVFCSEAWCCRHLSMVKGCGVLLSAGHHVNIVNHTVRLPTIKYLFFRGASTASMPLGERNTIILHKRLSGDSKPCCWGG